MLMLDYPIALNRVYRNYGGRMVLSADAKAWKTKAGWQAKAAGMKPLDGAVWVSVMLHPRLTKGGEASKTRIDLDASLKLLFDSLNGIAYHDDKQVERIVAEIGSPRQGGGLSVVVGEWSRGK